MRRGLEIVLRVIGVVAIVAGSGTVLFGAASVLGAGDASASLDSELRFYAAWYVVAGIVLLGATRRLESGGTIVRAVALGFLIAACGRLISWIVVGRPHLLAVTLMFVEFAIAFGIPPWHAAIVRAGRHGGAGSQPQGGR